MKKFSVYFRHNQGAPPFPNEAYETVECTSKAKAVAWGKSVAAERGWWFMSVEKAD